jgi:wobble nucleotide-excising tRNase
MIKKINKLRNFGIFHDFAWQPDLADFKKFNLIYGWNYSGKTTLSRVFRCFQLGQLHDGYPAATFDFELEDGRIFNQGQLNQPFVVRVFNSDFIRDNLKWEAGEEGIEPVLLLGEENIKLEQQLKAHRAELEEKRKKIDKLRYFVQNEQEKIENGLTGKASTIKNTLRLPNYDKRSFEPIITTIVSMPETNRLSDEQVGSYLATYHSTDKKDTISEITLSIPDISGFYNQTEVLLQKTATANIIERLKENPTLEKWVKGGLGLHDGKSICEFCGGQLPNDLFDKLNKHFSEGYNQLMTEIDQLTNTLESKKIGLELPDGARFYPELRNRYEQLRKELESEIKAFNETIEQFLVMLAAKRAKPFEAIKIDTTSHNMHSSKVGIAKNNINISIQNHNNRTKNFDAEIRTSKEKLIKHYASEFAIEIKYSETLKKIGENKAEMGTQEKELETIQNKIQSIEHLLSDALKGAKKINDYLHDYFGTDEIKMVVAKDNKYFKLERSGQSADNLSEGEKTAIAFSHFMVTLEDKGTTLADSIVFIDDPVSSLDCNHLFHTYSFIKNKLTNCKQLFISTHNYEFFNLIKDWRSNHKKYPETSLYLIEKTTSRAGATFKANLKGLPKPLSNFKSEYVYLFSLLYQFDKTPITDHNYLYIMPNLVRRYLEAYVGFRTLGGLGENLSILINDETQQEKIYKLINAYSHNSSSPRLLHFPDFSECKNVVQIVLDAVKNKDKDHYDVLVKAC